MVCARCGCEQGSEAQFCRECGVPCGAPQTVGPVVGQTSAQPMRAAAPPIPGYWPIYPSLRVRQHVQPLGIMWCVYGVYRLCAVLIAYTAVHALVAHGVFSGMPVFLSQSIGSFMPAILLMTAALSGAAILTGIGLLTGKPWARILAIIFGILALIKIPFGTALGIYTLWVLAPRASGVEWEAMTGAPSLV